MVILEGIIETIGIFLAQVEGRIEELSAPGDLEARKNFNQLQVRKQILLRTGHIRNESYNQNAKYLHYKNNSFRHPLASFAELKFILYSTLLQTI